MMNPEPFTVSPEKSLREVFECIGRNAKGIALLVEDDGTLVTTVTDGDLRRAILADIHLEERAAVLVERKREQGTLAPLTAPEGASTSELLTLMKEKSVRQIPIVDRSGVVVSIAFREVLFANSILPENVPLPPEPHRSTEDLDVDAVIMAGGFGKRLYPLTDKVPKPMLPVGDRPMLELIVDQLRAAGIRKIFITTHFMPEVIRDHFGDGSDREVEIEYVHEEEPLGTGGALGLLPDSDRTLLMMNGDILTHVDLQELVQFHRREKAEITLGVRQFDLQVPYGVVRCRDSEIERIDEKPVVPFLVNAGIYVVDPSARRMIKQGHRIDMPELVDQIIGRKGRTSAFPIVEYWLDIGRMDDYRKAQTDQRNHESS